MQSLGMHHTALFQSTMICIAMSASLMRSSLICLQLIHGCVSLSVVKLCTWPAAVAQALCSALGQLEVPELRRDLPAWSRWRFWCWAVEHRRQLWLHHGSSAAGTNAAHQRHHSAAAPGMPATAQHPGCCAYA